MKCTKCGHHHFHVVFKQVYPPANDPIYPVTSIGVPAPHQVFYKGWDCARCDTTHMEDGTKYDPDKLHIPEAPAPVTSGS